MFVCDVIKAVVCFYRVDSDAEFERVFEFTDIRVIMKHLVAFLDFLGLKELATKHGVGNYELKLYRMSKGIGGKTANFVITTDGQWQLELLIMLAEETQQQTKRYFVFL